MSLKYEDLLEDRTEVLKALFNFTGIPVSWIPDEGKARLQDSQAGTPFSSQHLSKEILEKCLTSITNDLKKEVNALCKDFNVLEFWEDHRLSKPLM